MLLVRCAVARGVLGSDRGLVDDQVRDIELLTTVDQATADAVARLVPQVSSRVAQVSSDRVRSVAAGPASCIVVARVRGRMVGSATLLTLVTLVGAFGYVEEVVVDSNMRGRGIGRHLVEGVVDVARSKGLDFVELTSRSSREAANALYQSLSFRRRETNVYRLNLR
jgi:ribosomal protein S18 acetylase RimI-like enzyme